MADDPDTAVATTGESVAVVIVDHGSRRHEANESLESFIRRSAHLLPYATVEAAHMELAEPSIATALDRCVAAGATTVVIAPYFLGPGSHSDRDIPALAAAAAAGHPGLHWLVAAPLGPDPRLLTIVGERVARCLERVAGRADECAACVGTGRCTLR